MSTLYQSKNYITPTGITIHTPTPPRRSVVSSPASGGVYPSRSQQPVSTPAVPFFDTPRRNLFSAGRAGPLSDEMDEDEPLDRGPVALTFSDQESLSGGSDNLVYVLSGSYSPRSNASDSDCTTVLCAETTSSHTTSPLEYLNACRQLGLSPMVQPAKRRRCRSHTPNTEASSGTLDSRQLSNSSLVSMSFDSQQPSASDFENLYSLINRDQLYAWLYQDDFQELGVHLTVQYHAYRFAGS